MIINAGLDKVVTRNGNGDMITYYVKDWVANEEREYGIEPLE